MQKLGANSWMTMWTSPRKTIRAIVDSNPKTSLFLIAAINFLQIFFYFNSYFSLSISYRFTITIIIAVILSPVLGAIWCYFFGWLIYIIGKKLGGSAAMTHVMAAYVWSRIPVTINVFMWFILLVFSSDQLFMLYAEGLSLVFINCIIGITGIWAFVLLVQALAELQRYSISKSIVNIVIAYAIIVAIVFIIKMIAFLIELFVK